MTQIITAIANDTIFMASDTRLNYHEEVEENGEKYQLIKLVADCCRKTFLLPGTNIGIQFLGIGFLSDGEKRYSLDHFLPKLIIGINGKEGIVCMMKKIFENLKQITTIGDTGNFVNGVMAGYYEDKIYIGTFNTFIKNNGLEVVEASNGNFIDSEEILKCITIGSEDLAVAEIVDAVTEGSKRKPHLIGEDVEVLKISPKNSSYILEGKKIFYGTQEDLFYKLKDDLISLNGKVLDPVIKEKINL